MSLLAYGSTGLIRMNRQCNGNWIFPKQALASGRIDNVEPLYSTVQPNLFRMGILELVEKSIFRHMNLGAYSTAQCTDSVLLILYCTLYGVHMCTSSSCHNMILLYLIWYTGFLADIRNADADSASVSWYFLVKFKGFKSTKTVLIIVCVILDYWLILR